MGTIIQKNIIEYNSFMGVYSSFPSFCYKLQSYDCNEEDYIHMFVTDGPSNEFFNVPISGSRRELESKHCIAWSPPTILSN